MKNLFLESLIELVNERGSLNTIRLSLEDCDYLYSKGISIKRSKNPYFLLLTKEQ